MQFCADPVNLVNDYFSVTRNDLTLEITFLKKCTIKYFFGVTSSTSTVTTKDLTEKAMAVNEKITFSISQAGTTGILLAY